MNNEKKKQQQKLFAEILNRTETPEFKDSVRSRIKSENARFDAEDAAQKMSRRQFLQTFNL